MGSQQLTRPTRALKVAVLDSGLTQRAIASQAGIDETRFSRIVNGKAGPFPRERQILARLLSRPVAELFPSIDSPSVEDDSSESGTVQPQAQRRKVS